MKRYLILLSLVITLAISNELTPKEVHLGCTIPLFSKKNSNCTSKETKQIKEKSQKVTNPPPKHDVKQELSLMVYRYQAEHSQKDKKIKEQLKAIKKDFLRKNSPKAQNIKPLSKSKKNIKKRKTTKIKPLKKLTKSRKKSIKKKILPPINHLPWIEIVTDDNINIYQLAQRYYGDRKKYWLIQSANQASFTHGHTIKNGTTLKIPMTREFKEQPFFINSD